MTEVATQRSLMESEQALQMAMELSMQNFNNAQAVAMCNSAVNGYQHQYRGVLVDELDSPQRISRSQNITQWVAVPTSEHVAEIVGRQGCKIKALRAKTNTYIKTPARGEDPVFVITGRPEDVSAAKHEVLSAADHFTQIRAARKNSAVVSATANATIASPNLNHGCGGGQVEERVTIYVRVPYRVVGLVVGPKGATIKRIQQLTSTYIVTPSRDKEPCFEVTGTPENVERAKREIESYIAMRTGNSVTDSDSDSEFSLLSPSMDGVYTSQTKMPDSKLLQLSPRSSASPPSGTFVGEPPVDIYSNGWAPAELPSHNSPLTSAVFGARSSMAGLYSRSNSYTSEVFSGMQPLSAPVSSASSVFDFSAVRETLKQHDPPSPTYSCGSNSSEGTSVSSPKLSLSRRNTCCMCHGNEVVAALVPCGHNLFCFSCARALVDNCNSCPVCNSQVSSVLRIYTQ